MDGSVATSYSHLRGFYFGDRGSVFNNKTHTQQSYQFQIALSRLSKRIVILKVDYGSMFEL